MNVIPHDASMVCKKYLMEKREESKKQKREEDKEGGDGKSEEEVKEKTEEEESKEEEEEKTEVEKEKEAEEKKPVEGSDPPEIREEDGVRPRAQERMLRKPEILSDESDVEDSKEDLKNLLPKEEAFSESDNEDSQENDQDFDDSLYYDDPDMLDTIDAGDAPPANISVKEEDGKFKLSIKRETPKSKPKKRKIVNTDGNSFVCDIENCTFTAPNRWTLKAHKETHKNMPGEESKGTEEERKNAKKRIYARKRYQNRNTGEKVTVTDIEINEELRKIEKKAEEIDHEIRARLRGFVVIGSKAYQKYHKLAYDRIRMRANRKRGTAKREIPLNKIEEDMLNQFKRDYPQGPPTNPLSSLNIC